MRTGLTLLDGGTGRELQNRGLAKRGSIWSALALIEQPRVVVDVHRAFVEAGADVIITNNYSVVPSMLEQEAMLDRFEPLTSLAGELAASVRDSSTKLVCVAGSLPPLHTSYQPDHVGPEEDNLREYAKIAELLAPHVDLFVCETMSTGSEARAAAMAAVPYGKPVWVAWTLDKSANGRLRSGESCAEVVALLDDLPVGALLFNCSTPEAIEVALPELRKATDLPIGAYANSFGDRRNEGGETPLRDELTPAAYADIADGWRDAGASIIGGCCGIGPAHIEELGRRLK